MCVNTEHFLSAEVWPVQCKWSDCHHSIPHDSLVSDHDTLHLFNRVLQDRKCVLINSIWDSWHVSLGVLIGGAPRGTLHLFISLFLSCLPSGLSTYQHTRTIELSLTL